MNNKEVNTMNNKQNYATPEVDVFELENTEEILLASGKFNTQNINLKGSRGDITTKQLDVK
jgi:hypothetical protein